MSRAGIRACIAALCLLAVCTILFFLRAEYETRHTAFLRGALVRAQVQETVHVGTRTYSVNETTIYDIPSADTREALRVAYAMALARRAPVLNIAGTDPDQLSSAASALETTQQLLAKIQKTEAERLLIAHSLYPIDFLQALAQMERSRTVFLQTGTESAERAYNAAVHDAIRAGKEDIRAYRSALNAVGFPATHIIFFDGSATRDSMMHGLNATLTTFDAMERELRYRNQCLEGRTGACDTRDLDRVLDNTERSSIRPIDAEKREHIDQTISFLKAALGTDAIGTQIYAIDDRSCMNNAEAPYHYGIRSKNAESGTAAYESIINLDDVRFFPMSGTGLAFNEYMLSRGILYTPTSPVVFYLCTQALGAYGRVFSMEQALFALRAHPEWLADASPLGIAPLIHENDIVNALIAATQRARAMNDLASIHALEDLSLMMREHSAGLESMALDVHTTGRTVLGAYEEGIPQMHDAQYLLIAKSGFPSLFPLRGDEVGAPPISILNTAFDQRPNRMRMYADMTPAEKADALSSYAQWVRLHKEFFVLGGAEETRE